MAADNSNLTFRYRSMYDYREDSTELVDLCRRCESINQASALMSTSHDDSSSVLFHCEFTDYLWSMEQYPESYCFQLVQTTDGRIIAIYIVNLKQVHFGGHLFKAAFARLARVDPNRRRQHLIPRLFSHTYQVFERDRFDFAQSYTLFTNVPSLNLQRTTENTWRKELCLLDILIVPTESNTPTKTLHKLTQTETERLWMVDLAQWACRPLLSDLRHIMKMNEYVGTFIIGDFNSGRYSAASVWQSSNAILCDDRSSQKRTYRGPYWLVFNFFQPPTSVSYLNDEKQLLLSSLSNMAFNKGIPFMLCHVERSSVFNGLCRKRALAITTEILSRNIVSGHMFELGDEFDKSPVWLDPRDFSSLLYFNSLSEYVHSQL